MKLKCEKNWITHTDGDYTDLSTYLTIDKGDPDFKPLGMDNRSYCRINGKWHYNSGGTELDWRKMNNAEEIRLIEDVFLETRAKQL